MRLQSPSEPLAPGRPTLAEYTMRLLASVVLTFWPQDTLLTRFARLAPRKARSSPQRPRLDSPCGRSSEWLTRARRALPSVPSRAVRDPRRVLLKQAGGLRVSVSPFADKPRIAAPAAAAASPSSAGSATAKAGGRWRPSSPARPWGGTDRPRAGRRPPRRSRRRPPSAEGCRHSTDR